MKKRIIAFSILLLFCLVSLSGCAPVFDMLNFNRKPLPTIDSVPEDGLVNKYQKQENVYSKTEFAAIVADSAQKLEVRKEFEETLSVFYSYRDTYGGTRQAEYQEKITVLDKDSLDEDEAYARYEQEISATEGNYQDVMYVFEDSFAASPSDYSSVFAFEIDEHIQDFPVQQLKSVEDGGFINALSQTISAIFESSYRDFTNGVEVLMIRPNQQMSDSIIKFLPANFSAPSVFGEFERLSDASITLAEDESILAVSITLLYEQGSVYMNARVLDEINVFEYNSEYLMRLPSFYFHFLTMMDRYASNGGFYNIFDTNVKAEVELSGTFYEEPEVDKGTQIYKDFVFYQLENKNYNEMYQGWNKEYISHLVYDGEQIYASLGEFFANTGGTVTQITRENNMDKWARIDGLYSSLNNFFYNQTRAFFWNVPDAISLKEVEGGYEIRLFTLLYTDYNGETTIECTKTTTITVEGNFQSIKQITTKQQYGTETQINEKTTFTYNFDLEIPSIVADYRVKW